MSRTYRRKSPHGLADLKDSLFAYDNWPCNWIDPTPIDPKSKEGKEKIARYHSDATTSNNTEPGPSWFRALYTERPQRREARREIHRYFRNENHEVILNGKNRLERWD